MFCGISMERIKYWAYALEWFPKFYNGIQALEQTNLSSDQLSHMSKELVAILHGNAWSRVKWREFKPDVLALAESLADYADYLSAKNKAMRSCHDSPSPV